VEAALVTDVIQPAQLTGAQSAALERMLAAVERNRQNPDPPLQHVLLTAPRGAGKSMLLNVLAQRLGSSPFPVDVHVESGLATRVAFPETILARASAGLLSGAPDKAAIFPWRGGDEESWEYSLEDLETALDARFGAGQGLLVLILDDFQVMLERVFSSMEAESRLRRLMQENPRIMVIAGSTDEEIQSDYERPLFQIFEHVRLNPFDAVDMASRLVISAGDAVLSNLRGVLEILGPVAARRLVIVTHLALSTTTARELFIRTMEAEAAGFELLVEGLATRPARLLDALIVGGEPVRPATLAERLSTRQNDIAPTIRDLTNSKIIRRRPGSGGKMTLYEVRDRLFANWYALERGMAGPVGAFSAQLLAIDFAEDNKLVRKQAVDIVRAALGDGRQSKAFSALISHLALGAGKVADKPSVFAFCILIELIRQPVDPALLRMLASSLAKAWPEAHMLLRAGAAVPFADPEAEARLSRPLNLSKDDWPHPDLTEVLETIRPRAADKRG
jgi:hypothetical protein